jgi:hypothetical protein
MERSADAKAVKIDLKAAPHVGKRLDRVRLEPRKSQVIPGQMVEEQA